MRKPLILAINCPRRFRTTTRKKVTPIIPNTILIRSVSAFFNPFFLISEVEFLKIIPSHGRGRLGKKRENFKSENSGNLRGNFSIFQIFSSLLRASRAPKCSSRQNKELMTVSLTASAKRWLKKKKSRFRWNFRFFVCFFFTPKFFQINDYLFNRVRCVCVCAVAFRHLRSQWLSH